MSCPAALTAWMYVKHYSSDGAGLGPFMKGLMGAGEACLEHFWSAAASEPQGLLATGECATAPSASAAAGSKAVRFFCTP